MKSKNASSPRKPAGRGCYMRCAITQASPLTERTQIRGVLINLSNT